MGHIGSHVDLTSAAARAASARRELSRHRRSPAGAEVYSHLTVCPRGDRRYPSPEDVHRQPFVNSSWSPPACRSDEFGIGRRLSAHCKPFLGMAESCCPTIQEYISSWRRACTLLCTNNYPMIQALHWHHGKSTGRGADGGSSTFCNEVTLTQKALPKYGPLRIRTWR